MFNTEKLCCCDTDHYRYNFPIRSLMSWVDEYRHLPLILVNVD